MISQVKPVQLEHTHSAQLRATELFWNKIWFKGSPLIDDPIRNKISFQLGSSCSVQDLNDWTLVPAWEPLVSDQWVF